MKLVHFKDGITTSRVISEKEYYDYWSDDEWIKVETKSSYESCRLERYDDKQERELIIIYGDNRQLRTRNTWKEQRLLRVFSEYLNLNENNQKEQSDLLHSVEYHIKYDGNIFHTEIDGQFFNNSKIGIEIKGWPIKKKDLDFFNKKMNILELEKLHLFAPSFAPTVLESVPSSISLWSYTLDNITLKKYYKEFKLPDFIRKEVGRRHVRFLMQNGKWTAPKRRMTESAKYTSSQKVIQELFKIRQIPVKVYYSLARVIDPISEFRGKGYPIDQIILGFDIDADPHKHIITKKPYCYECVSSSFQKLQKVVSILSKEHKDYKILLSGAKGFHFYLLEPDGKVKVGKESDVIYYLDLFKGLVDDFRSTYAKEWDFHRIFKLPGTIDATTGQIVKPIEISDNSQVEDVEKIIIQNSIKFSDVIKKIK